MSTDICVLTTKDFTILEVMRDRCLGRDDPMARLIARKLDTATVVFRDDVPADVATLSSRVSFTVNSKGPDTRVLSHDRMPGAVGLFLPITSARGLALLGLREGQSFRLAGHDGSEEEVILDAVHYQPEAARREKELLSQTAPRTAGRPALRLIQGALTDAPSEPLFDGPGPSAA